MKAMMLAMGAVIAVSGTAALAQTTAIRPQSFAVPGVPKQTPPQLVKRDTTAPDKDKLPYLLPARPPEPTGDDGSTAGKSNTE